MKRHKDNKYLTEDVYTNIEEGTCFKLASKPAVYEIMKIREEEGVTMCYFQAFHHYYGNLWSATKDYMQQLFRAGDLVLLSETDKHDLHKY